MSLREQLGGHVAGAHGILDGGQPMEPTEAGFVEEKAGHGEEALLPLGIVYRAHWTDPADGMARHARSAVRALSTVLPVTLRAMGSEKVFTDDDIQADFLAELSPAEVAENFITHLDERLKEPLTLRPGTKLVTRGVLSEVGYLRKVSFASTALAIQHGIFNTPRSLEAMILPPGARLTSFEDQRRVYEHTIVYTSWERTTVAPELVEILNRVAQVWLPCQANCLAFRDAGVDPDKLRWIPCPYDPATHAPTQIPGPRGSETVPDGLRFYSIGKWEPRKNHHGLIGAFLQAYSPKDRASLYIKTSPWSKWDGYPSPEASLRHWMSHPSVTDRWTTAAINQRVRVTTARLTADGISDLHRKNNIYVSASHGEAWDLPAFDAVAAGNRLVFVPYGGAAEYAPEDSVKLEWCQGPVHPDYGWEPNAEWAEYEPAVLVEALRRARPPSRRLHPPLLHRQFSHHAVGTLMLAAIMQLPEDGQGALWEKLLAVGCFG